MLKIALRGVPADSPALGAPADELVALWRARSADSKREELRHALSCAKHAVELRAPRNLRRAIAPFVSSRPALWLVRYPSEAGEVPRGSIAVREWETGAPRQLPWPGEADARSLAQFLGLVIEQALYCANLRELHRITLTLEGSVHVPRQKRRLIHDDDPAAWAAIASAAS